MSKLLSLSIDVTKLDKSRFYKGNKGTYAKLDVWVSDEPDKYGQDASVSESLTKEERDAGNKKKYVGSGKKIYGWGDSPKPSSPSVSEDALQEEVPFWNFFDANLRLLDDLQHNRHPTVRCRRTKDLSNVHWFRKVFS